MRFWNKTKFTKAVLILGLMFTMLLTGCSEMEEILEETPEYEASADSVYEIPPYDGNAYIAIHDNIPYFTEDEITDESYEYYSELDELGRCGVAEASIGRDLMPTEGRGNIGSVKPAGWKTVKYDIVDGKYLYNRCHLIGFQLTAENANKSNLITGTRYLNIEGMLPFENMVADYIKETENHVMYRVTPLFDGDNLVAAGVLMEGYSVEDQGEGIEFCIFAYNVQPGIEIDYATGDSWLSEEKNDPEGETTYVLNTNTMKFHKPDCSSAREMKDQYREEFTGDREELIERGYEPCKRCNP